MDRWVVPYDGHAFVCSVVIVMGLAIGEGTERDG